MNESRNAELLSCLCPAPAILSEPLRLRDRGYPGAAQSG